MFRNRSGRRHLARVASEVRTSAHHSEGTQTMDEMDNEQAVEPAIDENDDEMADDDFDGRGDADERRGEGD
jgi:hypothetical protein